MRTIAARARPRRTLLATAAPAGRIAYACSGGRLGRAVGRARSIIGALALLPLLGCGTEHPRLAVTGTGGDPRHGPELLRQYGCGACHTIAGVGGADGMVGPPLTGLVNRLYIAGALPNTPEHLIAWIQAPQTIDPGTAMPDLGVTEPHARHIAAYLYTLED